MPTPDFLKATRDRVEGAAFDRWLDLQIREGVAAALTRIAQEDSVPVRVIESGIVGRGVTDMHLIMEAQKVLTNGTH